MALKTFGATPKLKVTKALKQDAKHNPNKFY